MENALWPGWQTVCVIGRGSYGTVYEVEREIGGKLEKAAVKCISLPPSPEDIQDMLGSGYDQASLSRYFDNQLKDITREYNLMAEMKGNSNIVSCEDFSCERQSNGFGWDVKIRMELLTPMIRMESPSAPEVQALQLGKDLCKALILCKSRNIVHRDIKPQNIFISRDGNYKLGDFGIARTMEKTSGATKAGTFNYMAPEVYNNRPYGHQADIYSLGMVLYWLLNEKRGPFLPLPPRVPEAAELEQARMQRFRGEALPPPAHGSKALKRIVCKACAFDPKDRYANADELYRDLQLIGTPRESEAAGGEPAVPPVSDEPHGHKSLIFVLGAIIALAILAAVFLPRMKAASAGSPAQDPAPRDEGIALSSPSPSPEPATAPDALGGGDADASAHPTAVPTEQSQVKLGLITLGNENDMYDQAFIEPALQACEALGIPCLIETDVPEGPECYEAACKLAEDGCTLVFADSFGHELYMIQAAEDFPAVTFVQARGVLAHTLNLSNFSNVSPAFHEASYLSGVAAGMKLNRMIEAGDISDEQAVLGYIAAFPYAEEISRYTAFYLGAKSQCYQAEMLVSFTGSWFDYSREREAAADLIDNGCVLISETSESMGAPAVCEERGVPNISPASAPTEGFTGSFLISVDASWSSGFLSLLRMQQQGASIPRDWCYGAADACISIARINTNVAAPGTEEKLLQLMEELQRGELHVFDCSAFTVDGEHLTSYLADVDEDASFTPDTEVVFDGYFHESYFRAAPYFNVMIDGITLLY